MRAIKRWSFMLFLIAAPLGCGDDNHDIRDAGGMDLPAVVGGEPCLTDNDCPSASFVCAYKVADGCAAKGHCAPLPMPTCASFTELCGCNGSPVRAGGCFYADGYAGGATTGATFCPDDGGAGD